jgi:hypothetical protein
MRRAAVISTRAIYEHLHLMEVLIKLDDDLLEDQAKCPKEWIDVILAERIELRRDMQFVRN